MVAFLLAEPVGAQADAASGGEEGPLLAYMKKLAPPAVDLELRALCTHAEDAEGVDLLVRLLRWLARRIATGADFEVLQAYLHRALVIYLPLVAAVPELAVEVAALQKAHAEAASRFRHLVQKNLCLLKLMANLPIV